MKTLSATALSILLALTAIACDAPTPTETGFETSTMALAEGSPEAIGLLEFLNDPTTDVDVLDRDVPLNRRAARNLIHHRNGFDGVAGTYDDNLFDSLAEVDGVRWVGPAAMESLVAFALSESWIPDGDDILGTWDGVTFTVNEAEITLAFANEATLEELDEKLALDRRAAKAIVAAQPIESVEGLAGLYYVGHTALRTLKEASVEAAESVDQIFLNDLGRYLSEWYALYDASVIEMGGVDLAQAQGALSSDLVAALTASEAASKGYDVESVLVLGHPDVVFPDSEIVWFGAYERDSGELIEIGRIE